VEQVLIQILDMSKNKSVKKVIALTGGPSAGKTSILDIVWRAEVQEVLVVPEAASILYGGGFPRSRLPQQIQSQQCAIYAVQKALEEIQSLEAKGRTLICDRGSLDGLAYWPGSESSFFEAIHSSMRAEIDRYDWVIHLDSASGTDYESSGIRVEGGAEAGDINQRVKQAWREHPRRLIVPNNRDFMVKVATVLRCFALIQQDKSADEVRALVFG
jgi:predicted ATPase